MTADTEATPDLWNSDQVRELIVNALARSAGDSQAEAVMEVIRDVLATVAAAQCESAARTQQTITRLRAKLDEARTRLALHVVDPDHHADLMRLMEDGATVRAVSRDGHVYPAGKIAGIADHPTVMVDCGDGTRRVLPQTFEYREVPA